MKKFLYFLCPAIGPFFMLCFGGSSQADSSQTTNNTDSRVVGGNDSINLSANNSTVSMISTDHAAVSGALNLGTHAIDANAQNASQTLQAGANMFQGALDAVSHSGDKLALAYQSGQAGDQTQLKYAGFVVVGLAVVMLMQKKG